MNNSQIINVAVAESSVILRSGLVSVLKKLTDVNVIATEVTSMEGLHICLEGHHLDIVFINPTFEGWFNIKDFKTQHGGNNIKFVAILCTVTDMNLIKDYDDSITLYDDVETINKKIVHLLHIENSEAEQEELSQREKEIICYVVKGMTNKEIAETLYLSVHTVITHRRNISRKLQIHSPTGLTIYAIVNKLVQLKDVKM